MKKQNPLASVADSNLLFFCKEFGVVQKTTAKGGDYFILKTGCLDSPDFNCIILPREITTEEITDIEETFKSDNLAFSWWVDKNVISKQIYNYFQNNDYSFYGDIPGLTMRIEDYHYQKFENTDKIRISEIRDMSEFKKWCEILIKGFGFNESIIDLYCKVFGPLLQSRDKFIALGAYDEKDNLVSTASIFFDSKIAGFYNDTTIENYRNKGIMTALYRARIEICKELDVSHITLQTSPMSTNIAIKMGFTKVRNYQMYISNS